MTERRTYGLTTLIPYLLLAAMPLVGSRPGAFEEEELNSITQFFILDSKEFSLEGGKFFLVFFSSCEGGGTLPRNSYKPSQDL